MPHANVIRELHALAVDAQDQNARRSNFHSPQQYPVYVARLDALRRTIGTLLGIP